MLELLPPYESIGGGLTPAPRERKGCIERFEVESAKEILYLIYILEGRKSFGMHCFSGSGGE